MSSPTHASSVAHASHRMAIAELDESDASTPFWLLPPTDDSIVDLDDAFELIDETEAPGDRRRLYVVMDVLHTGPPDARIGPGGFQTTVDAVLQVPARALYKICTQQDALHLVCDEISRLSDDSAIVQVLRTFSSAFALVRIVSIAPLTPSAVTADPVEMIVRPRASARSTPADAAASTHVAATPAASTHAAATHAAATHAAATPAALTQAPAPAQPPNAHPAQPLSEVLRLGAVEYGWRARGTGEQIVGRPNTTNDISGTGIVWRDGQRQQNVTDFAATAAEWPAWIAVDGSEQLTGTKPLFLKLDDDLISVAVEWKAIYIDFLDFLTRSCGYTEARLTRAFRKHLGPNDFSWASSLRIRRPTQVGAWYFGTNVSTQWMLERIAKLSSELNLGTPMVALMRGRLSD